MKSNEKEKPSAENLKQELWTAIIDLRKNKISVKEANAISASARAIVSVVRSEITIVQLSSRAGLKNKESLIKLSQF